MSASPLLKLVTARTARVGVIGLGYVGLPLAVAAARAGFPTIGFDVDPSKPAAIAARTSYIEAVPTPVLAALVDKQTLSATTDLARLAECQVIIVCVPTPLTRHREPDLSYIEETARTIARHLKPGTLVSLESTTYPGTTTEVMKPLLETSGLVSGRDFFVGFSPEREDPGNREFTTTTIPKVVAGDGQEASRLMEAFYGAVVARTVVVSTPATAEAVKITENIYRAINIALVNELKVIFDAMGIDVWEVINAAKTKPFGFQAFYPGPGLGGHCIPIDPFYLTWKAREFDIHTRFIELAGQINTAMPRYVVARVEQALDAHLGLSLSRARVLVIGMAYKKNVPDVRESPSFKLIELLEERGAACAFHDPHVAEIPPTREHAAFNGRKSVALTRESLADHDVVLIATDHDAVDYGMIGKNAGLVVDCRNRMASVPEIQAVVVKA